MLKSKIKISSPTRAVDLVRYHAFEGVSFHRGPEWGRHCHLLLGYLVSHFRKRVRWASLTFSMQG